MNLFPLTATPNASAPVVCTPPRVLDPTGQLCICPLPSVDTGTSCEFPIARVGSPPVPVPALETWALATVLVVVAFLGAWRLRQ